MITCRLLRRWQKTVIESSQSTLRTSYKVPAKALLFGEYGLLRGGSAAAVLLPQFNFQLSFALDDSKNALHNFGFKSSFFSNDVCLSSDVLQSGDTTSLIEEQRNLYCYLSQYRQALLGRSLQAEVTEAFSPAYGFGSSSAIQAAFHLFLANLQSSNSIRFGDLDDEFWEKVYATVQLLQGGGSGYDVAVQIFGALLSSVSGPSVLSFKDSGWSVDTGKRTFSPIVSELRLANGELKKFGCFVETGIRSNTRAVLRSAHTQNLDELFFDSQKSLADEFINQPSLDSAKELCRSASLLAIKYGLLPQTPELMRLTALCTASGLPWKTMGAGFGDCLWILASRAEVTDILKDVGASELTIRYSFEDA